MNIKDLNLNDNAVSTTKISQSEQCVTIAIRLKEGSTFPKHTTPIPALLTCMSGAVLFEDENGEKIHLKTGDFMHIIPDITHWLVASEESHLLLIK